MESKIKVPVSDGDFFLLCPYRGGDGKKIKKGCMAEEQEGDDPLLRAPFYIFHFKYSNSGGMMR